MADQELSRLQIRSGTDRPLVAGLSIVGWRGATQVIRTILLIILILLLLGSLPAWPYSTGWGYYPSGGLGLVLLIVIILIVLGRI
jgi:hypothetical protein